MSRVAAARHVNDVRNKERLADDRFAESWAFFAYFLAYVGGTQTQISQNLSSANIYIQSI